MRSDWLLRARAILNRQWDPIHLSRMPDADEWDWADEYDQYGDQLAGLIEVGVSDEGLLTYLEWAEVAWIGLSGGRSTASATPGSSRRCGPWGCHRRS